jgi:hypothetical protein
MWEKPVVTLEILKNDVRDLIARLGRPKTMNNGSTNPDRNLRLCPTTSKNTLTKEGQNMPENAKKDLIPFYTNF